MPTPTSELADRPARFASVDRRLRLLRLGGSQLRGGRAAPWPTGPVSVVGIVERHSLPESKQRSTITFDTTAASCYPHWQSGAPRGSGKVGGANHCASRLA